MRRAAVALLVLPLCAAGASPAPTVTEPPPAAPSWPNAWVQRGTASVVALDKLSAQSMPLSIRVGDAAPFRTLTIAVRSCVSRPPDQPADAAAWLDVTDSRPGSPEFHGWMLSSEPGLSVLQSPTYDVRVLGCR